jgi:peptidoglycan/LPS O-acetylase OafA/YrhL
LAVAGFLYPSQNLYFRHVTNPILLEFVAGCLLATVYVRYRERITRRLWVPACAMIAAGVAALVVSEISGYDPYIVGSEAQRFLVYGIPALAIVSGAVMLEQMGFKATAPIILLQGAASYSIYLFHMFALQPAAKAVVTIFPSAGPYGGLLAFAAAIGAAGVVGTLAHVLLEKPLGRQISVQFDRSAGWIGVRRAG